MHLDLEKTPSQIFSKKLVSIKYIQHIQNDLRDSEAKRIEIKAGYLNQSYVFHLVAFWQVFIEELLDYGFRRLEKSSPSSPFAAIARSRMNASLGRFNTPKRENINRLFNEALGIEKVTRDWSDEEATTLTDVLDSRHSIAHTGFSKTPLSYESNFARMKIIFGLSEKTERRLISLLQEVYGVQR